MSEPTRKRVRILQSFFASNGSPWEARVYKMIQKLVQLMDNKLKERKWRMKEVKEKLQIRGHFRHVGCANKKGCALKMERRFAIFVPNRRQIHLDQQVVQISKHQLFKGIKIARITKLLFMRRPCEIHSKLELQFTLKFSLRFSDPLKWKMSLQN